VIAFRWVLFSAGIVVVLVGFLLAGVMKPPDSRKPFIDPRMRDDEIVRNLKRGQRIFVPNLVVLLGLACVLASVIWRLILLVAPEARP
jgi:hypothetical protein